jgi:predicted RNA-binding protein with PUA-like domain
MNHWLLKSEPGTYSWDDLVREGRVTWDGITNALALIHMRAMRAGDEAVLYHSGSERRAMGLARITKGPYADPRLNNPKLVVVEIAPVAPLPRPVSIDEIRKDKAFADWDFLRQGRLSVVPVPGPIWARLMKLGGAESTR